MPSLARPHTRLGPSQPSERRCLRNRGRSQVCLTASPLLTHDALVLFREDGSKVPVILTNDNSLWRFKFNKRAIQLFLEPGQRYEIRVHRLIFGRNIISVEGEETP